MTLSVPFLSFSVNLTYGVRSGEAYGPETPRESRYLFGRANIAPGSVERVT